MKGTLCARNDGIALRLDYHRRAMQDGAASVVRDHLKDDAAPKGKSAAPPPLNKWQAFCRGMLHVDTGKLDPWIALRNAGGVSVPLAMGIAIGMPLGGLAV